ncbi:DUF2442 domain-containing protein [Pistricoccus aurantiacus]|uniref:DUF2442 domain-containing protein n=1 Tax=Pistricoccus aurantiacus TaxID=1883414 RepID=UPI00362B1173
MSQHQATEKLGIHNKKLILELPAPPHLMKGFADATPDALSEIEISPSGLGLHWPQLDADLYVPALLESQPGSKQWMAHQLGATGSRSRSYRALRN